MTFAPHVPRECRNTCRKTKFAVFFLFLWNWKSMQLKSVNQVSSEQQSTLYLHCAWKFYVACLTSFQISLLFAMSNKWSQKGYKTFFWTLRAWRFRLFSTKIRHWPPLSTSFFYWKFHLSLSNKFYTICNRLFESLQYYTIWPTITSILSITWGGVCDLFAPIYYQWMATDSFRCNNFHLVTEITWNLMSLTLAVWDFFAITFTFCTSRAIFLLLILCRQDELQIRYSECIFFIDD